MPALDMDPTSQCTRIQHEHAHRVAEFQASRQESETTQSDTCATLVISSTARSNACGTLGGFTADSQVQPSHSRHAIEPQVSLS